MKGPHHRILAIVLVSTAALVDATAVLGQNEKKVAQTGMQFLSVVSDARAAGLAYTVTAVDMGSEALFSNPATMGFGQTEVDATFSLNRWIADIDHLATSVSWAPGNFGRFGLSVHAVDYGSVETTVVAANDQGYEDTGVLEPTALAIGVGYARALSDRFAVGGQVKWVQQDLGVSTISGSDAALLSVDNKESVLAFDFGTLYRTAIKDLSFGFSVRNFSQEIEYASESFQLPLTFSIGVAVDLANFGMIDTEIHDVNLTVQATNARSHEEQIGFGLEYRFLQAVSLRGGYISNNDEDDFSFGFGVSYFGVAADYAYTPQENFDGVQRLTVKLGY
ncbi:MAG TPA: PorV/PorQ family protein [Rhodothermia bacterium]